MRTTPSEARACECGSHWFEKTSGPWVALVDPEDAWLLENWKWQASGRSRGKAVYAQSRSYLVDGGQSDKLHRAVLDIDDDIDHKNKNCHDNRRSNLRPAEGKNAQNRDRSHSGSSQYKGVILMRYGQWRARIRVNNANVSLGVFRFEIDAAVAYNYAAAHYYGEFAQLNKIVGFYPHD